MNEILNEKRQRWITGSNPNAVLIERFVNQVMKDGKKILAYRIVLKSIAYVCEKFIAEIDKQSDSPIKTLALDIVRKIYSTDDDKGIRGESLAMSKSAIKKSQIFSELLSYICIRTDYKVTGKQAAKSNSVFLNGEDDLYWKALTVILRDVIEAVRPLLEVRSRRVGGANYQVPESVDENRGVTLAIRWILASARKKTGLPMHKNLGEEMYEAMLGKGWSVKKRDEVTRMAQSNRAFAHLGKWGRR